MGTLHKKIAITKNGKDSIRILPMGTEENKAEIKFSFLDESFILRQFKLNRGEGMLLYKPTDFGLASYELTYHNSNTYHTNAVILPKYKDNTERKPILNEIINLDLKNLIVPIPICRITVNKESDLTYKPKEYHNNIDLSSKYNTTEIFISSSKYDPLLLSKRFPYIVEFLFPITTIDFLIYGAGLGCEPIINKMFENKEPIVALQSDIIGNYRFYYRTYELVKSNALFLYSNIMYSQKNIIEFFNNVDYLDLLATTNIGYKIDGTDRYDVKPAYKRDIENLRRIGFHKDYIESWFSRFYKKEIEYKSLRKIRSGILLNVK